MVRHKKKSTSIPHGLNNIEGKLFRKLLQLDYCNQGSCKAKVFAKTVSGKSWDFTFLYLLPGKLVVQIYIFI